MAILTSKNNRENMNVEGFGYRYDDNVYYPPQSDFIGGAATTGGQNGIRKYYSRQFSNRHIQTDFGNYQSTEMPTFMFWKGYGV